MGEIIFIFFTVFLHLDIRRMLFRCSLRVEIGPMYISREGRPLTGDMKVNWDFLPILTRLSRRDNFGAIIHHIYNPIGYDGDFGTFYP